MITTHVHLLINEEWKYKEKFYYSKVGDKYINPTRVRVLTLEERQLDSEGKLKNKPQEVEEYFHYHETEESLSNAIINSNNHKFL